MRATMGGWTMMCLVALCVGVWGRPEECSGVLPHQCYGDCVAGMWSEGCPCPSACETECTDCMEGASVPTCPDIKRCGLMADEKSMAPVQCDNLVKPYECSGNCMSGMYMEGCPCPDICESDCTNCMPGHAMPNCPSLDDCLLPDDVPMMTMYFHFGITEYIMFEKWVPKNSAQYFGSVVALVVMGLVREWLVVYRQRRVLRTKKGRINGTSEGLIHAEATSGRLNTCDSCLYFISLWLGYVLMLIIMTYNVGLCLAVTGGMTLGHFLFTVLGVGFKKNDRGLLNEQAEEIGDSDTCCDPK